MLAGRIQIIMDVATEEGFLITLNEKLTGSGDRL